MRAGGFVLVALLAAGCRDFDGALDAGCREGRLSGCFEATGGGAGGGGGETGGGAATGGGVATGGGSGPTGGGETGGGAGPTGGSGATGGGETGGGAGATGGSGPTGGGTATGGGSGVTFDAGTRQLPVEACIGRDGWCWLAPKIGGNDLYAIWGTSDQDVFVAGTGGTLLHWNGLVWRQVATPSAPLATLSAPEPAWLALAVTSSGVAWLGGEQSPLYSLSPAGVFTLERTAANRVSAASDGSEVFVVNRSTMPHRLERTGGIDEEFQGIVAPARKVMATQGTAWVTFYEDTNVWNYAAPFNLAPSLTSAAAVDALTSFRDRPWVATTNQELFFNDGSGWQPGGRTAARYNLINFVERNGTDIELWGGAFGGMNLLTFDGGIAQVVVNQNDSFDWFFASWVSPEGTLWLAGGGGRVVRIPVSPRPASFFEVGRSTLEGYVYDVSANEQRVVVGMQGGKVWKRELLVDGGTPSAYQVLATGGVPIAVRATASSFFVVDEQGCVSENGQNDVWCVPAGARATVARSAGIDVDSSGRVWASIGGRVTRGAPASSGTQQQWQFAPWNHTADVLAVNGGAWVALNAVPDITYGDVRDGSVMFVPEDGGTTLCSPGDPSVGVYGLSRSLDGSVLVAGEGVLGRCAANGTWLPETPPDPALAYVSLYESVDGRLWALTESGELFERAAVGGAWLRERLPLGSAESSPGTRAGPRSRRLTGNSRGLYIGTGSGGVLWKPLP